MAVPVIAVFDVGKTNKKLFLFNEAYEIVFERSRVFQEITDDDGDPCEDVANLNDFIREGAATVLAQKDFAIRTFNCSAYGASMVYLDQKGQQTGPLYNYLKPFPEQLQKNFYETYGGEKLFTFQTASPVLGSLNSGMQLYRIKHEKPDMFARIRYALHLPQYLSYLLSGKPFSEITSIGCHTNLWNFQSMDYHYWVQREGLAAKFPDLAPSDMVVQPADPKHRHTVGIGLHDSSAALIPYLVSFREPFVLLSTGTWSISLNPFNPTALTREELECDCLCYLQYRGTPVKASRLFAGHTHDEQVKRIAAHFNQSPDRYFRLPFDNAVWDKLDKSFDPSTSTREALKEIRFANRDLASFSDDATAYHQLCFDLMVQQYFSTQLVIRGSSVKQIYVDGGFSNNDVYMRMLAAFFPEMDVYASSIPQATAMGAALAIHEAWNGEPFPEKMISLRRYEPSVARVR